MTSPPAPSFLVRAPYPSEDAPFIVSASAAMHEVLEMAECVASRDAKVLITGESGVGKDLVARYIHANSSRAGRPFIAVNCGAFSESLLESELFGHARGSFTDAHADKPGKLELAHQGTVFLDEVGEMSLRMQALLLRFLENGEIQSIGRTAVARVNVRVIAATNRDLMQLVADGRFREDLLYRINVVRIHVPALRERPADIRPLIQHMASRSSRAIALTEQALTALETYTWPGNVRELHNVVERLVWMAPKDLVEVTDLSLAIQNRRDAWRDNLHTYRSSLSDELFDALVSGRYSFFAHVRPMFLNRDITRDDLRGLVRRGLTMTGGSYRGLLKLFGLQASDYKRFMNFLSTHKCAVDFREFRTSNGSTTPASKDASRPIDFCGASGPVPPPTI